MLNPRTIQEIALFSGLPPDELKYLADKFNLLEFPAGTEIIQEGYRSDQLYIILSGTVEIFKSGGSPEEHFIASRGAGTLLGELGMFDQDGQHTASVRAVEALQVVAVARGEFEALLRRQPELAYNLVRTMSNRLAQSESKTVTDLREKNRRLAEAYQQLKEAQEQLVEQEKLAHELEIARQIQQTILPEDLPTLPGYEFGALISPARAVGGDFYDFIPLSNQRLGIVVGDVSDKGIPAALFMALAYSLLRSEARRHQQPGAALAAVNRALRDIDVARMYVTLIFGILDCQTGELNFARAGHPLPVVLEQSGERVRLEGSVGQPLGILTKPRLDLQTVQIPTGGMVLLFTDGVTEASNLADLLYENSTFLSDLRACMALPAQQVCQEIFTQVMAHTGSPRQQDDITFVCIKRTG